MKHLGYVKGDLGHTERHCIYTTATTTVTTSTTTDTTATVSTTITITTATANTAITEALGLQGKPSGNFSLN